MAGGAAARHEPRADSLDSSLSWRSDSSTQQSRVALAAASGFRRRLQTQQKAVPDSVAATTAAEKTQKDQPQSAAGPAAPEPRMSSCRNRPHAAQPVSAVHRPSQHRGGRMASKPRLGLERWRRRRSLHRGARSHGGCTGRTALPAPAARAEPACCDASILLACIYRRLSGTRLDEAEGEEEQRQDADYRQREAVVAAVDVSVGGARVTAPLSCGRRGKTRASSQHCTTACAAGAAHMRCCRARRPRRA